MDAQSPQSAPISDTASGSAPSDQSSPSSAETYQGTVGSTVEMEMVVTPVASPGDIPYLENEEDRSLFNHYLHTVARALSRAANADSTNPFLTTLVPMAAASDTLTSVLLGLSGCHWRRVYPGIWKRALARQGRG